MCAINGFNSSDNALILKMNEAIKHRGPDATGVFTDSGITLGHNRLSIIDLSEAGSQPMKSDDGRYILIYNGEIYNFQELKGELGGYPFRSASDSEVILAAYKKWGRECVSRFNGIFAFAIWDTKEKELFLARDHNGIKPLYYHHSGTGNGARFAFSSELKALLAYGLPPTVRKESVSHYLRVLYVPEPYTMFEGIMKLPPASYGVFKNGSFSITCYWPMKQSESNAEIRSASKSDVEEMLRQKIGAAVKRQLVSDRPVGVFLSGGLDSTIVLHHMAESSDKISTYSVGFDLSEGEQQEKFNEDFNLARRTAALYKTDHHEVLLTAENVRDTFEKAVWHLDEPIANPTIIAQYALSQFSKKTVTVVLGGDGGDELFGGYDRYQFSLFCTYYRRLPKFLRTIGNLHPRLRKLDIPAGVDRFAQFLFQKDTTIAKVAPKFLDKATRDFFQKRFFSDWQNRYDSFEQAFMETDRESWLVDESLARTDTMTMSAGIEERVPLLDKEVVEFARSLPLSYKVSSSRTKIIMRDAYAGLIPDFIERQPKRGWFSPGAKWLRNPVILPMVQDVLSKDYYSGTVGVFEWDALKDMLRDHVDGKKYNATMLWAAIIFQVWAKQYNVKI